MLHESGIKPHFDRWLVRRAEQYVAAHPGRRLREHRPLDVDSFGDLGLRGNLKDWQFRQVVDAIQKLFELVGVDWLGEVDWGHWRDSARSFEGTHPTVARDYAMPAAPPAPNPTPFDALRGKHAALLDQVRAAIRRRGFSDQD